MGGTDSTICSQLAKYILHQPTVITLNKYTPRLIVNANLVLLIPYNTSFRKFLGFEKYRYFYCVMNC